MSRFIRNSLIPSTNITSSDVCAILPTYTGCICTASLKPKYELLYSCRCWTCSLGSSVILTLPTSSYNEFVIGFYGICRCFTCTIVPTCLGFGNGYVSTFCANVQYMMSAYQTITATGGSGSFYLMCCLGGTTSTNCCPIQSFSCCDNLSFEITIKKSLGGCTSVAGQQNGICEKVCPFYFCGTFYECSTPGNATISTIQTNFMGSSIPDLTNAVVMPWNNTGCLTNLCKFCFCTNGASVCPVSSGGYWYVYGSRLY